MLLALRYTRIVMQNKKQIKKKPNIIIWSCNILWKMSEQFPFYVFTENAELVQCK